MNEFDFLQLKNFITKDVDNLDEVDRWFEQILEYQLNGEETKEVIEILFNAAKWLMKFERTNAQEIKDLAIAEATNNAEKEAISERDKEALKKELNILRERLTLDADDSDITEKFRAQVESLQEQNSYLRNQYRESDRELLLQREKTEKLTSKLEQLEKERTGFLNQQSHLEETIRELNNRLNSKVETEIKNEAGARKLKQRSEQAAKLSSQLQEIAQQNDTLTAEVERLSSALSSATKLIEETTVKYQNVRDELTESYKLVKELTTEKNELDKQLNEQKVLIEKLQSTEEEATSQFKIELEEAKARYELENTEEKEEELERLRVELVNATNLARRLFGDYSTNETDHSAKLQTQILDLNNNIETLGKQLDEKVQENISLMASNEQKDTENARISAELKKLREKAYGSAEEEIRHLETQLKYRDKQIEKLTLKCSLLQIEAADSNNYQLLSEEAVENQEETDTEIPESKELPDKKNNVTTGTITDTEVIEAVTVNSKQPVKIDLTNLEANAMLIASLNNALMQVLQELNDKDKQINKISALLEKATDDTEKFKEQVLNLETKKNIEVQKQNEDDSKNDAVVEMKIAITEYKEFMKKIREEGSDLERHYEAACRNLVAEKIIHSQMERKLQLVDGLRKDEKLELEKLKRLLQEQKTSSKKQQALACYEFDLMTIEIAKLQNLLLHSVPQDEYNKLTISIKQILQKELLPSSNVTEEPDTLKQDSYGVELLMQKNDENVTEKLGAKIDYLQNIVSVLTNHNDYWQAENTKLQVENEELKNFLEDLESESRLKSLVVAIERRFLDALKEQKLCKQKTQQETQLNISETIFAKKQRQWLNERKKLISIIRNLKVRMQAIATDRFDGINVQQMLDLKKKIDDVEKLEKQKQQKLIEITKKQKDVETELISVQCLRMSFEEFTNKNCDMIKLQKTLQASFLLSKSLEAEVESLKSAKQERDLQIEVLKSKVEELSKQISESFAENLLLMEPQPNATIIEQTSIDTIDKQPESLKNRSGEDTESLGGSQKFLELYQPCRTKTVIYDNENECQKRINKVKQTAEICIQNYKEQLANKEMAIKRYKQLLKESAEKNKLIEPTDKLNNETTKEEKKFKKSDEILESDELQETKCELMKAQKQIEELEKLNCHMGKEIANLENKVIDKVDVATQADVDDQICAENVAEHVSPTTTATPDSEKNAAESRESRNKQKSDENSSDKTIIVQSAYDSSELERTRANVASLKNQNRYLIERIKTLSLKNKDLEQLCNEMKNETLEHIENKFSQNSIQLPNLEILKLSEQVEKLKTELLEQKRTIKRQKEIIDITEEKSSIENARNSKEEVARWSEKKDLQKLTKRLKKKVELLQQQNDEAHKKLEKSEKQNLSLCKDRDVYLKSQKSLQSAIEKLKMEKSNLEANKDHLEHKLAAAENTIRIINEKLINVEKVELMQHSPNNNAGTAVNEKRAESNNTQKKNVPDDLLQQLEDSSEKYSQLQNDYKKLKAEYESVLANGDKYAVVAILSDKLKSKEKIIEKQVN